MNPEINYLGIISLLDCTVLLHKDRIVLAFTWSTNLCTYQQVQGPIPIKALTTLSTKWAVSARGLGPGLPAVLDHQAPTEEHFDAECGMVQGVVAPRYHHQVRCFPFETYGRTYLLSI